MANNTYPMLSAKNWWSLRKKFKQTIPGGVTSNYLASVLDMQEVSATNNIMPYIKQISIVDQDGKTGEHIQRPHASIPATLASIICGDKGDSIDESEQLSNVLKGLPCYESAVEMPCQNF